MASVNTTISHGITLSGAYPSPLAITASGVITNPGTGPAITAPSSGTVINAGQVIATAGPGIRLSGGGTVTNAPGGLISGPAYAGIYADAGSSSIYNAGTIRGAAGLLLATTGTLAQTLIDSGTIIGTGGTAIAFGGGDDLLQLLPGTLLIQGAVSGGGGADTLEFAATTTTGTLNGSADFAGFTYGTVDTSAQWVINGATFDTGTTLTVAGTLTLAGTIVNTGSVAVASGYGFRLAPGAYLLNTATGAITRLPGNGTGFAPTLYGTPGGPATITNLGTITNTLFNVGLYLGRGGTITNGSPAAPQALIDAILPIYLTGGPALVTNTGTIRAEPAGGGPGIALHAGGTIINAASASVISGPAYGIIAVGGSATIANYGTISASNTGIYLGRGGTITNAGTIATSGRTAIRFGGPGANLLTLEGGYAITGAIIASGSGNVLQLQGSAASPVVVNLASLRPAGFPTIRFAGGSNYATLAIAGTTALPGTIAGFIGPHDTIDLTTIGDAANDVVTSFDTVTNRLTISGAQGSVQLHLDAENYAGLAFLATSDGAGGTFVYPTSAVPPSINHTIALQAVADQAPSRPFTGVTITDPSIGQDETLTVALSPAGGGTLSNLGGGSFNPATGTYTITDSPGSVSAALAGLVFTPAAPAGGLLATTAFTLTVTGPGGSATDTASSVTTVTQLPPYLGLAANQYRFAVSASGGPPVFSGGGGITESLVSNPLQGGVYAVPAGAAAAYLGGTADATLYNPTPSGALLVGNAGNDQILAGIGPDTVVTGTGANRVLLGSGNAVVISAGQDQIAGGSGNASITSGSNNPLIFLGPGANTVTAGVGGNPTVVAGRGADTIAANGGSQLWLGAGTALVTSTGADTVIAGPGAATIAASGDALVFGADGPLHFTGGSGAPTVIGGSGGATIQGGSGPMLALAYGPAAFTAAGGATTVAGFGASGITITGGSGPGLFVGAPGGHNAITTGTGPATILGGGDGDLLTATSTAIIVAGPGAETINAGTSSAPTNIFGGSGAAVIRLGSGLSEVLAGPGSATVIAGTGTDILAFAQGTAGTTIVQGFNPLHDAIGLLGYAPGEPAAALAGARTAGGSETLTLSDGTHITLLGFTGLTVGSFL